MSNRTFPFEPSHALLLAVWGALLVGLLEGVHVLLLRARDVPVRLGDHVGWMAPLANLPFFVLIALFLFVAALLGGLSRSKLVIGGLVSLAAWALFSYMEVLHTAAIVLLALGIGVRAGQAIGENPSMLLTFARRSMPALILMIVVVGSVPPLHRHLAIRPDLSGNDPVSGDGPLPLHRGRWRG